MEWSVRKSSNNEIIISSFLSRPDTRDLQGTDSAASDLGEVTTGAAH